MATQTDSIVITDKSDYTDDGGSKYAPTLSYNKNFSYGTGANQANLTYKKRRTIALAATPDDIDLNGGGLISIGGDAANFVRIRKLTIINLSTTAILTVGAGSNPWITWLKATGDGVTIGPNGHFSIGRPDATGFVVTPATGDILRVASDTNATNYDIKITGADA